MIKWQIYHISSVYCIIYSIFKNVVIFSLSLSAKYGTRWEKSIVQLLEKFSISPCKAIWEIE